MTSHESDSTSKRGGPAAIRGFRLQVLLALDTLLSSEITIRLEGIEDVDILDPGGNPTEIIQVKSREGLLSFSSLTSESGRTSFWKRLNELSAKDERVRGRVISFGEVGPELVGALNNDVSRRESVARKLRSEHGVADPEELIARVSIVIESESELTSRLSAKLVALCPAAEPLASLSLLSSWLLLRAEQRAVVTSSELRSRLELAGRFASDCRAYAEEWFRTIVPLQSSVTSTSDSLRRDFFEGVAARYEHVVAGIDVLRPPMLDAIDRAFSESRVAVVHGASGEGKSTLAYRYAHSRSDGSYKLTVDADLDLSRTLTIANALAAFARATNNDVLLLLDVRPGNRYWSNLVELLAAIENVRILVTIREEDWRSSHGLSYRVLIRDVSLEFTEREAREIYDALQRYAPADSFLSFEEAWASFGSAGPVLEFTHLVTRHQSLRSRLENQVRELLSELDEQEEEFCRLAACGTGYGGRVHIGRLSVATKIRPIKTKLLLARLEREYFVRISTDTSFIEAVHSIRSRILAELFTDKDLCPLSDVIVRSIDVVALDDVEHLLFESFLICESPDLAARRAVGMLGSASLAWRTLAGLARALLWLDISEYVAQTRGFVALAKLTLPGAWRFLLPWHFQPGWDPETTDALAEMRKVLLRNHPEQLKVAEMIATSVPELKYLRLRIYLEHLPQQTDPPTDLADWVSISELTYWHAALGVSTESPISVVSSSRIPVELPLQIQAHLVSHSMVLGGENWNLVFRRICERYRVVWLDDSSDGLRAIFLPGLQDGIGLLSAGGSAMNARAVDVSSLLRTMIPGRTAYGCIGVAWPRWAPDSMPQYNPIEKRAIKAHQLGVRWGRRVLPVVMQQIERSQYPETWKDHASLVRTFRHGLVEAVRYFLIEFAKNSSWDGVWQSGVQRYDQEEWLERSPDIPMCARDPWCIGTLGWDEDKDDSIAWFPERYVKYYKNLSGFHAKSSLLIRELFFSQPSRDWGKVLESAISTWEDMCRFHLTDHTPLLKWWMQHDIDRQRLEERVFLIELIALAEAREKQTQLSAAAAVEQMRSGVARILEQTCNAIGSFGYSARVAMDSDVVVSNPSIVLELGQLSWKDFQAGLRIAKECLWRESVLMKDDLQGAFRTIAERIDIVLLVQGVSFGCLTFSMLSVIVENQAGFLATMVREMDAQECVRRGLLFCPPNRDRSEAFDGFILAGLALADFIAKYDQRWVSPFAEQCLEEIYDRLRASIASLHDMALADSDARPDLASIARQFRALCSAFLSRDGRIPTVDEIAPLSLNWAYEKRVDEASALVRALT